MPVTINCASVNPEVFDFNARGSTPPTSRSDLFVSAGKRKHQAEVEESSWQENPPKVNPYDETCLRIEVNKSSSDATGVQAVRCENGLVNTLCRAYNEHYHVVLRPDDVWIAILAQLSLYVNANAEKLRSKFVDFEGKKQLTVTAGGSFANADVGAMAKEMGNLLQQNIKDPSLHSWILPDFTTSTENDTTIASIIMMATLQKYFDFKMHCMCGLPSVTLLGSVEDWKSLRSRVDRLGEFGEETKKWMKYVQKTCDSFVDCFDPSKDAQSRDFFSRVCHYNSGGSGPTYLSGWVTVFTVFNTDGKWQAQDGEWVRQTVGKENADWPIIDSDEIAPGVAEVPVLVDDNGNEFKTVMLAGLPGMNVGTNDAGQSVLSPTAGWAMFTVPKVES